MFSGPVRGGTRGGQGDFKWSDVADDKDRENYLGHSILAPVGRWQKNKDITWYNKNGGAIDEDERLKAKREEIQRIKAAEEDALSAALGFKPAPRDPMGSATVQSSSNAIPLGRSRKPDSPSEHEYTDKKAEKAARKAERAAKREKKAMEAEEKKLKKLLKSSRHQERGLEKSHRSHSFQERSRERNSTHRRDIPEGEFERSKTDRAHDRPHDRDYYQHRGGPRSSDRNERPKYSPRLRRQSISSESSHNIPEKRRHSRRSDDGYSQSDERRPHKSFSHSKHRSRLSSPPIRDGYARPTSPAEHRREGRPRSRSPRRSRHLSPTLCDRHRYSLSPAHQRRDGRPRSRTPQRSPSLSPPLRDRYPRSPSPAEEQRERRHRSRSPLRREQRDYRRSPIRSTRSRP